MLCTLNPPQSLNAISPKLVDELHHSLERLHNDTDARVVILRGAGRAFLAGLDLKENAGAGTARNSVSFEPARPAQSRRSSSDRMRRVRAARHHTGVRARGGGGRRFALALASDIRIAGE